MARLPYADPDRADVAPIAERIRRERGSVLNLYAMLLHSPPVAEGWLTFLTAIRQKCSLSGRLRELAILRIAAINGADYEFRSHQPFARAEGISQQQIDALRQDDVGDGFDAVERSVLAYADAMTREVHVKQEVFDAVRPHFDERGLVELTATIGAYNLVSRFLEALQVDHD